MSRSPRPDGDDADGAGTVYIVGHGQVVAAIIGSVSLRVPVKNGIVQVHLFHEAGDLWQVFGIILIDAEDGESLRCIFLLERDEPGHLYLAGRAPGGPEVDKHGFAAIAGERDWMAREIAEREAGRGFAEKRRGDGVCPLSGGKLSRCSRHRRRSGAGHVAVLVAGPHDEREAGEDNSEDENATRH